MTDAPDAELLAEYARNHSEAAFGELVQRYLNLVYSTALRYTGNAQAAEEIAQAVFIILARKAGSLGRKPVLAGWLYHTARLTAANWRRAEARRVRREQEAFMQSTLEESAPDDVWRELAPLLDDAMACLGATDRDALVLRYFQNKSLRDVGAALGIEERAAQKRVARGLEKLHAFFTKRGISTTSAIIAGAVSANSVHAAPVAIAKSVTAVAIAKGAAASTSTLTLIKGALKIMAWTKAKTAIVAGVGALLAVGTATLTVKEIAHHREESVWSRITRCDIRQLEGAPQAVSIRPTRFAPNLYGQAGDAAGKLLGLQVPFDTLLARAYAVTPCRILASTPLPQGAFDYVANVPWRQTEALQESISQKFGITARRETRETDVLVLTMKRHGASGLRPAPANKTDDTSSADIAEFHSSHCLISSLIFHLEYYLHIPIIDQTALDGYYDIDLKWENQGRGNVTKPSPMSNPDALKQAILDQLGLELVPGREPVEMLVVEKAK